MASRRTAYSYDPAKAKALLKEAGYGPDKPVKAKIMVSTAGSGQMLPLPMNELIQQMVKPIGIDLDFEVVEWGTMLVARAQHAGLSPLDGRRRDQYQPRLRRPLDHVPLLPLGLEVAEPTGTGPISAIPRSTSC